MKLKCIGGAMNGTVQDVANYYGEHDIVQIAAKTEFKLASFEEDLAAYRENRVPNNIIDPYHIYKIAKLEMPHNTAVRFLIPENWRIEDALYFAFGI